MKRLNLWILAVALFGFGTAVLVGCAKEKKKEEPLTIAYSDWPGWLVWEIANQKGFFKDAGVNVELKWFDYGPSIDAFAAGKVDAILIVSGDALTIGDKTPSTAIVLTDYSNGNDKIIGKKGIESIKDLKGKKVGLEENLVEHILLMKALEANEMKDSDVTVVPTKTDDAPQTLKSGKVDAVGAWYPISGRVLKEVPGSTALFTSADAPGLIYDSLNVNRKSLANRRDDWKKVVGVWFKCLEFLNDKKTHDEAVEIMAKRISAKPDDLAANLKGTKLLDGQGNLAALKKGDKLDSVYGSMKNAQAFYLKRGVYKDKQDIDEYVDSSLVKEVLNKK